MIHTVIDSIESENIPEYEINIVGGLSSSISRKNTVHIPFDETVWQHVSIHGRPGAWTTKKKNLGVKASKYQNLVIMHDYIKILPGYYQGFLDFGLNWDICVHQCLLYNGVRGDGWRLMSWPGLPYALMVPYDIEAFVKHMIIQGSYWMAKKETMLKYPVNEKLLWGMEEDAEWSRRAVPNCHVRMNPTCVVQYLKPRPDDHNHEKDVQVMESYNSFWNEIRQGQVKNYILHREKYGSEVEIP